MRTKRRNVKKGSSSKTTKDCEIPEDREIPLMDLTPPREVPIDEEPRSKEDDAGQKSDSQKSDSQKSDKEENADANSTTVCKNP